MSELSVLVVDDDVDIAANVNDILSDLGYDVDLANDGKTALAKVNERQFDVALLDFKMPDMDGATLYQSIRKIQPQMVAIMVTAYAGSDGVDRAINAGVWQVLRKPVDIQNLLSLIGSVSVQPLILVVGDDEGFCSNLWEVLREQEYRIGIAHSTDDARKQCEANDFDVILLDVCRNTRTSEDLLNRLTTTMPGTPRTIVVAGQQELSDESTDAMIQKVAESVFCKPLPMKELLAKIETLVAKK